MADLHKRDLIRAVATATGHSQAVVEAVLDGLKGTITDTLVAGHEVVWTGFGRFELRRRSARRGINPQTGARLAIDGAPLPGFTTAGPYKALIGDRLATRRPGATGDD